MAITEHESGTKSTTLDTEEALNTTSPETTDGVFQFFVDCNAMLDGDVTIIRVKEKVTSGGTQRIVFSATLSGSQGEPAFATPSLVLLHGWDITIEQTDGTARSYPWSIRKVG